jgi:hypothetical protein
MADNFQYDVFLSHSSKDKPVVRELAQRLKADAPPNRLNYADAEKRQTVS